MVKQASVQMQGEKNARTLPLRGLSLMTLWRIKRSQLLSLSVEPTRLLPTSNQLWQ